jgi:hypothetical protein
MTPDTLYYLYYNGTKWSFGDAVLEVTPWDFSEAQAAYVWFGATDKWALRECHGIMQYQSHREDHFNIGTYRRRGATDYGAVTFTPNTFPTAASPASVKRPAVAACELWDEDLMTINPALTGDYCQLYLLNAAVSTFVQNQADIVPFASATTRAAFNLLTGAVWSLSALNTNQYGVVFVVEVPVASDSVSQQYRKVFVLGQAAYASAAAAEAVSFNSLNLSTFGTAAVEWLATQRIVIRGSASNDAWLIQSTQQLVGSQASLVSVSNTGMVNPMTAIGEMIYGATSGVPTALAAGTAGQLLQSNGAAAPTWVAAPSGASVRTYTYSQPAVVAVGAAVAAAGAYIAGFPIGYTMLAAGTIRAMSCSSIGPSSAGTIQVSINGGAAQTIATIVGSGAPAAERHATTAIAVAQGDYVVLKSGTAAFSSNAVIVMEVS